MQQLIVMHNFDLNTYAVNRQSLKPAPAPLLFFKRTVVQKHFSLYLSNEKLVMNEPFTLSVTHKSLKGKPS